MTVDPKAVRAMASAYTAAWNSGSPQAVASFYAPDGHIVINRGEPWSGRKGIGEMAAGFFADVPDLPSWCAMRMDISSLECNASFRSDQSGYYRISGKFAQPEQSSDFRQNLSRNS